MNRSFLWLVETPQVFKRELLVAAHRLASERGLTATDDATLVEQACGVGISMVVSDGPNFKITSPVDLELAQILWH